MPSELDSLDRDILRMLQADATRPVAEVAAEAGLSQSPCWRRIQRLQREGYITKQVALLDRRKLGFNVEVFAFVRFERDGKNTLARFEHAVRGAPEILECHMLMGDMDFLLRVVAPDVGAYEKFLRERLSVMPGVRSVNSMIALSPVKQESQLPLDLLDE